MERRARETTKECAKCENSRNKNMADVKIYTTPTCHYCHMAKEFFTEKGVDFTAYDVSADSSARAEMLEKSNQMGVPVIDIDGNIVVGFDERRISALLSNTDK